MTDKRKIEVKVNSTGHGRIPGPFQYVLDEAFDIETPDVDYHLKPCHYDWVGSRDNIVIDGEYGGLKDSLMKCKQTEDGHSFVTFYRLLKFEQKAVIENLSRAYPHMHFTRPISNFSDLPNTGRFVMKPLLGARGMCQTVVDMTDLNRERFSESLKAKTVEEAIESGIPLTYGTTGREAAKSHEVRSQWENRLFMFEEFVDDVQEEYRAITNHFGQPHMVMKRNRIVTDIPDFFQATGIDGDVHVLSSREDFVLLMGDRSGGIYDAISSLNSPMASFDIYKVKDDQGQPLFGLFEFSQEFGKVGLPEDVLKEYMTLFLHSVLQGKRFEEIHCP